VSTPLLTLPHRQRVQRQKQHTCEHFIDWLTNC